MSHTRKSHGLSWADWYADLCKHAQSKGGSAADADAWREDYDSDLTVAESWFAAWGDE